MFGLSLWEIGVVMLVALVVLGPRRLPALARSVGKALRSLQRASSDLRNAVAEPLDEVRRPLQQMRDDLYHTVGNFERQVRTELEETVEPLTGDDAVAAPEEAPVSEPEKGPASEPDDNPALEPEKNAASEPEEDPALAREKKTSGSN